MQAEYEEEKNRKRGPSLTPLMQEYEASRKFGDVQGGSSSTGDRSALTHALFAPQHIDIPNPEPSKPTPEVQRAVTGHPRLSERIPGTLGAMTKPVENFVRGIPGGVVGLATGAARGPETVGTILEAVNPLADADTRREMAARLFPHTAEKLGVEPTREIGQGYGPAAVDRAVQGVTQPEGVGGFLGQQAGMLLAGGAVARGFRGERPAPRPAPRETALPETPPVEVSPAVEAIKPPNPPPEPAPQGIPEHYPGSDLRDSDIAALNQRMADRRAGVVPEAVDEGLSPLRRRAGEGEHAVMGSALSPLQQEYEASKSSMGELADRLQQEPVSRVSRSGSVRDQPSLLGNERGALGAPNPQTKTPEFRRWFGESKVVDEKGEPVVVYHGTDKNFRAFNTKKTTMGIHWFTSDRSAVEAGEVGAQGRGKVLDLYASLKKPAGWEEYHKYGLGELRSMGYDGAILPENDGTFTGFAFEPHQLKSASRNTGAFDPANKNIAGKGALPLMAGMAGGIAGGFAGYASADPNDSKAKKILRAALGAVGGGVLGAAGGRGLEKIGETRDAFRKVLAPATRSDEAGLAGNIIRAHTGQAARDFERARTKLHEYRNDVQPLTTPEGRAFVAGVEDKTGAGVTGTVRVRGAAKELRRVLDTERDQIIGMGIGALEHFNANYFPHMWEDPNNVGAAMAKNQSKRPLAGSKAFLKQRKIPTIEEGLTYGLKPITDNPLDMVLLKLREMRRFRMAHEIMGEMEGKGLTKFVAYDGKRPDGYAPINDAIARTGKHIGGKLTPGQMMAPEPVATVLNNYLSPGLRGNALFDAYMGVGNVLNQAQLGLSFFHLGFTSMDAMVSKTALGIEQAVSGRPIEAAKSFATMPTAPLSNYLRGSKLMKAYLVPGSQGVEFAKLADAVTQGGGRVRMEGIYKNNAITKFMQAVRRKEFGAAGFHMLPAALEAASKPLMEHIVPRQKLGVFADLARFELSKLKPGHTVDEARAAMSKVWDSVDNRMGQLVYDNLFWHRALKDLSMASVRSVGWNLGTIRELGGGLKDAVTGKLTHRAAYVAALPITVGLAGAVTNYLYTGEGPKELKDYFFPRNGQTDEAGNADRVNLPSYMKDVFAYVHHPVTTLEHKMHPLIGLVADMLHNEDYYGDLIRNPDDPFVKQMQQEASFLAESVLPFGVQNIIEERKRSGSTPIAPVLGLTPAPREEVRTPAQNKLNNYVKARIPGGRTPERKEQGDARSRVYQQVSQGTLEPRAAIDQLVATGMDRSMAASQVHQHRNIPALVRKFKQLTLDEAERVYAKGTPEEQNLWLPVLNRKRREGRRHAAVGE